jgi:hypothetical protein
MVAVQANSGAQLSEASCKAVMAGNAHSIVERIAELEAALDALLHHWRKGEPVHGMEDLMDRAEAVLRNRK